MTLEPATDRAASQGWPLLTSPYHAGELAVQTQDGTANMAERMGRRMIRDHMPDQHRTFFAALPILFVGALDGTGQPWGTAVTGPAGFLHSPDPKHLQVGALPGQDDPARQGIRPGAPVAVVGVEFHTRRRNRMTGKVAAVDDAGFTIQVDQSFGNCPQYIQARNPRYRSEAPVQDAVTLGPVLDADSRRRIGQADTLFIASASPGAGGPDPVEGVDVSHRGGRPGFVRVEDGPDGTVLTFPDFNGNRAFNTFGNIAVNPRAGLLFPDFGDGTVLSLAGRAEILWDDPSIAAFDGAIRMVRFVVAEGRAYPGRIPFAWSDPEPAPQIARTGRWG